jgi:spermidine/putrescine transport system permease protein
MSRRLWLLAPSLAVFFGLFVAPLVYFFVLSFWQMRAYRLRQEFTLTQYGAVFTEYGPALLHTFLLVTATSLATTLLAFAYAYFCRFKAGRYETALIFVALVTMFGGYLTKIYMWKTILGSGGILNSLLIWLGVIAEPITVFLYNPAAVAISLAHYTLPLAILPIYGALRGIGDVPIEAARDIGAGPRAVLFDIVLPQIRLSLVTSFALTFLFCIGDYVTPTLVGGPYSSMIGLFIQGQFGQRFNPPLGAAMSFTVIGLSVTVIGLAAALLYRATRVPR